jgi:spore coat polysaccharide biosynthesis predicted glycosyltransferase SpsG
MPTIYTEVAVDVELDDFNTDELIDELEERGYSIQAKDEVTALEDQIRNLKEDFVLWKDLGMKNEMFEKIMQNFFKETIDEHVI